MVLSRLHSSGGSQRHYNYDYDNRSPSHHNIIVHGLYNFYYHSVNNADNNFNYVQNVHYKLADIFFHIDCRDFEYWS